MTTPAINRSTVLSRSGTQRRDTITNGVRVTGSTVSNNNHGYRWDKELRPASNGIPRIGSFRACGPWSHDGQLLSRDDGSEVVLKSQQVSPSIVWETTYKNGGFWRYNPASLPIAPVSLVYKAEIKALNKLKDQDIHLGNFLAEGGKTVALVGNTASRIARQVRLWRVTNSPALWALIKRVERFGTSPKDREVLPSSWLELQYGWRPLLRDVMGACAHLSKLSRDDKMRFKASGSVTEGDFIQTRHVATDGLSYCESQLEARHSVHVNLWYRLRNPVLAELSSLGLVNPLEIVWECLPYSFVVDWFSPIGSWLSALTGDVGYDFESGSRSTMTRGKELITRWHFNDSNPLVRFNGGGPRVGGPGTYKFVRFCYLASPVPGVYVKNPLSLEHMLNGLALLRSSFK